ncbi:MAG: hypothetical protein ACE149_15420 [Armatimonadota bacterium]
MDRREVLCVAVMLLVVVLGAAPQACAAPLPFVEGFEAFPSGAYPDADGWYVLVAGKSAYVTGSAASSGLGSFRLDSWPWSARLDCIPLDAVPDHFSYQASICADRQNGWSGRVGMLSIYSMFDRTGPMYNAFVVDAKTGRITFYGQSAADLGPCVRGQWYKVQADLDFESSVADLWVNDLLVAEDVPIMPREFLDPLYGTIVLDKWGVSSPTSSAFSNVVYFDDIVLWEPETAITVEMDVRPDTEPDAVNLSARGVLPVAIFSSAELDATQLDPATLVLSGAPVALNGGKNAKWMVHPEDVDGDGLLDLIAQFDNQSLDPAQLQDGVAYLTGATHGGDEIEGQDEIILVGRSTAGRLLR